MGVGAGLYMYDVVVKKFTFAISSPDEFLVVHSSKVVRLPVRHFLTTVVCVTFVARRICKPWLVLSMRVCLPRSVDALKPREPIVKQSTLDGSPETCVSAPKIERFL